MLIKDTAEELKRLRKREQYLMNRIYYYKQIIVDLDDEITELKKRGK